MQISGIRGKNSIVAEAFKDYLSARRRSFATKAAFLLLAGAAVFLGGCITFLTDIKVKGDGSGTLVQTITMNPEQMKASMETVAKQMGATMTESKEGKKKEPEKKAAEEPFKTDDLKGKAADLGEGVTFVSAEKIDTKTAAGVRVTYAFKDINKLAVNPKPEAAMGMAGAGASAKDSLRFRFEHKPGGNAVLTVVMARPKHKPEKKKAAAKPAAPPVTPEVEAQQTAMMKQLFKGLRMGMAVEVEGSIVKTNSPYVDGSKVTLIDIDFDSLLSDEANLKALSKKTEGAADDEKMMEALKGIKGVKITTAPEVTIEFAPK